MEKRTLKKLLENLEVIEIIGDEQVVVSSVTANSRKVTKNTMFIAVKGFTVDSHSFIETAIHGGATVIIGEKSVKELGNNIPKSVTYVQLKNTRKSIGIITANFYGNPSDSMVVVGITGTDGKTTTSHLLYQILKENSFVCGMISTLGAFIGNEEMETGLHVTSPDPEDVQNILHLMKKRGVTHVVLEITSHALDQDRFSGVHFDIGILTNITHEHLDYHKTFENYRLAKLKLFFLSDIAILNADDASFDFIKSQLKGKRIISYGFNRESLYRAAEVNGLEKVGFKLLTDEKTEMIETKLVGRFNIYNCLAAVSAAEALEIPLNKIRTALFKFTPPKGRMEEIYNNTGVKIIVDFAHTPNGLENLLTALKTDLTRTQKLIVVFGSAGERDHTKRMLMGKVAGKLASISIVTAEDPRSEKVTDISKEIIAGIQTANGVYKEIDDRGLAIYEAINTLAKSGDIVVICGKGHETSMAYGKTEYEWSDQRAVEYSLRHEVLKINKNSIK